MASIAYLCIALCLPLSALCVTPEDGGICCFPNRVSGASERFDKSFPIRFYYDYEHQWRIYDWKTFDMIIAYDTASMTKYTLNGDGTCRTFQKPNTESKEFKDQCIPSDARPRYHDNPGFKTYTFQHGLSTITRFVEYKNDNTCITHSSEDYITTRGRNVGARQTYDSEEQAEELYEQFKNLYDKIVSECSTQA